MTTTTDTKGNTGHAARLPEIELRDYFAAAALQVVAASQLVAKERGETLLSPGEMAEGAFNVADAMLAERNRHEST